MREARAGDGLKLAPRLRAADLLELHQATVDDPGHYLELSIALGRSRAVEIEGEICCLYGVTTTLEGNVRVGRVWLMGSDLLIQHSREFLRRSPELLADLCRDCDMTWNLVDCRNRVHIRWLRWMGYRMLRRVLAGLEARPFLEFCRIESHVRSSSRSRHRRHRDQHGHNGLPGRPAEEASPGRA